MRQREKNTCRCAGDIGFEGERSSSDTMRESLDEYPKKQDWKFLSDESGDPPFLIWTGTSVRRY